jgi:hypothetical protein
MTQPIDFDRKLSEQLDFIKTSAQAYDDGRSHEAIRIATALRVLFHDTNRSTSLCKHLGKSRLMLASTFLADPGDGDLFHGLVGMKAQFPTTLTRGTGGIKIELQQGDGTMRCHPLGIRSWSFVNFDQWWRKQTIFRNKSIKACRRDIVLSAANRDGGAHVDAKYDEKYDAVAKGFGVLMLVRLGGSHSSPPQPGDPGVITAKFGELHLAAIRQMAYEILASPDIVVHKVN